MPRLSFNRQEIAGAFGDIGTDLPLIIGILLATKLSPAGVFIAYGLVQIASGLLYGLPMPVQPLKAMAVVVLAGQATGGQLQLAGLMIGLLMLALAASGALDGLQQLIPVVVVRGIQAGLGLNLARAALGLAGQEGPWGWAAAAVAVAVLLWLRGHRRIPGALLVIGAGALWAAVYRIHWPAVAQGFGWVRPQSAELPWAQWPAVFALLVLPQLPLSLSNSVIATHRTVRDLFPEKRLTLRAIGFTYSAMNLLAPWLGGIPVCHGCGGLAGYYALGARTGGAVVFYGGLYVLVGALFSGAFQEVVRVFPTPVLGAVLVIEAGVLLSLLRDQGRSAPRLALAAGIALLCVFAPQGYLTALVAGTIAYYVLRRVRPGSVSPPAGTATD
ncbi:MAG: putative sulfate/molybdate transporter [Opitutales bacterium]